MDLHPNDALRKVCKEHVVTLDGSTNPCCMTFTGTGDGSKFLVKDAAAGTCPGAGPVCGNDVKEGAEQCDGRDATACPGNCQADCTCGAIPCDSARYPTCSRVAPSYVCCIVRHSIDAEDAAAM